MSRAASCASRFAAIDTYAASCAGSCVANLAANGAVTYAANFAQSAVQVATHSAVQTSAGTSISFCVRLNIFFRCCQVLLLQFFIYEDKINVSFSDFKLRILVHLDRRFNCFFILNNFQTI